METVLLSFNPRPRTGGDRISESSNFHFNSFNPRPRTGGDKLIVLQAPLSKSFNPRPRTGGDCSAKRKRRLRSVSIRAPARGATVGSLNALKSHV